jgi:hypothetical protein
VYFFSFFFFIFKKYCDRPEDVLLLSSIVIVHDARLQLGELVPASPNADMVNFLSFDAYDIDLSKVMNDFNLNFILLQTTSKFIIVVEYLNRFLTEKWTATRGVLRRSGCGWQITLPQTPIFFLKKNIKIKIKIRNKILVYSFFEFFFILLFFN